MRKPKKKIPNPPNQQKNRSVVNLLLAIFCLLLAWFLFWFYDWYDEIFGWKNSPKNALKQTLASIDGANETLGETKYVTIENTPIQYITQQLGYDAHYVHKQTSPSAEWSIQHNIGRIPSVFMTDLNGEIIQGTSKNTITLEYSEQYEEWYEVCYHTLVSFNTAETGYAIFN